MARIPLNLQMEIRMEQPQRKYKFWNRSFENIDKQHRRNLASRRTSMLKSMASELERNHFSNGLAPEIEATPGNQPEIDGPCKHQLAASGTDAVKSGHHILIRVPPRPSRVMAGFDPAISSPPVGGSPR